MILFSSVAPSGYQIARASTMPNGIPAEIDGNFIQQNNLSWKYHTLFSGPETNGTPTGLGGQLYQKLYKAYSNASLNISSGGAGFLNIKQGQVGKTNVILQIGAAVASFNDEKRPGVNNGNKDLFDSPDEIGGWDFLFPQQEKNNNPSSDAGIFLRITDKNPSNWYTIPWFKIPQGSYIYNGDIKNAGQNSNGGQYTTAGIFNVSDFSLGPKKITDPKDQVIGGETNWTLYKYEERLNIKPIRWKSDNGSSDIKNKGTSYNVGAYIWNKALNKNADVTAFLKNNAFVDIPITISDLKPGTKYYAQLIADENGQPESTVVSNIVEFTTLDDTAQDPFTQAQLDDPTLAGAAGQYGSTGQASIPGFTDLLDCGIVSGHLVDCFIEAFYYVFYMPTALILQMAAGFLDIFMAFSLSDYMYRNDFIETGWTIVRDICNILFIFILLWTAFKIIINDSHFQANKIIVNIIIMGLLINFSLFFTKLVIDAGNITARVFYNQLRVNDQTNNKVTTSINSGNLGVKPKAFSEALASSFQMEKVVNQQTLDRLNEGRTGGGKGTLFFIILMGIVINIIAAWMLFKAAFHFLGRILTLWIAMIFSPAAFTTKILPSTENTAKIGWGPWMSELLSASFMASFFLFFLFLIGKFINSDFIGKSLLNNTSDMPGSTYLIMILMQFLFIIGLLKYAGDIAKKMSGEFGSAVAGAVEGGAKFLAGAAIGVATGGAALAARNTIGRGAAMLATEDRVANLQEKAAKGGASGWVARQQLRTIQGAQKASFDVRQTAVGNKFSSATGINLDSGLNNKLLGKLSSTGAAGGFEGARQRKNEDRMKKAESLGENLRTKNKIESDIKERKGKIEGQEEIVDNLREAVAQAKANGGTYTYTDPTTGVSVTKDTAAWQKELSEESSNLRELQKGKTTAYTSADVGKTNAAGKTITTADVGKKEMGLAQMEKALINNSKALAREYMSNTIRKNTAADIGLDKRDSYGNITEFGHAHGVETTNNLLRRMLEGIKGNGPGLSIGALVTGTLTDKSSLFSNSLSTKLGNYIENRANTGLHDAEHLSKPSDKKDGHGHGSPKSTYKGPTNKIFEGLFKSSTSGGHDSHGGGGGHGHDSGGHDSHGGGGGHH